MPLDTQRPTAPLPRPSIPVASRGPLPTTYAVRARRARRARQLRRVALDLQTRAG